MTPTVVALMAFACMFAGARLGMYLRSALPEQHLSGDSKDVVRLGMGLIATLTALVLGLVIASAKNAFDQIDASVRHTSADILTLDRVLAGYGPETKELREQIRSTVDSQLARIWDEGIPSAQQDVTQRTRVIEGIDAGLRGLSPQNDSQRELQSRALQLSGEMQAARWLLLESQDDSIPTPFLVIVVFWLTVLFWSFGLFAPRNPTVLAVLLVCALSSATAVFLILELERPFGGIVKVSSAPLHYTLSHLGD